LLDSRAREAHPTAGGTKSAEAASQITTGELCSQVELIFRNAGIVAGRSKVSRLVRDYRHRVEHNGFPLIDYMANRVAMTEMQRRVASDELRKVITYADPTGECAVNNVFRARQGGGPSAA